jgi:hypothetical protein
VRSKGYASCRGEPRLKNFRASSLLHTANLSTDPRGGLRTLSSSPHGTNGPRPKAAPKSRDKCRKPGAMKNPCRMPTVTSACIQTNQAGVKIERTSVKMELKGVIPFLRLKTKSSEVASSFFFTRSPGSWLPHPTPPYSLTHQVGRSNQVARPNRPRHPSPPPATPHRNTKRVAHLSGGRTKGQAKPEALRIGAARCP